MLRVVVQSLVTAAGAVILLTGCTGSPNVAVPTVRSTTTMPAASPTIAALTDDEAMRLVQAASSGDPTEVTSAVTMPAGQEVSKRALAELSEAMSGMVIDVSTFTALDDTTATVQASSDAQGAWTIYLLRVDNRWMISTTVKAPS